jgi:signal transduction histidine kinase
MDALPTVVRSVAHDLNNLLTAIRVHAEFLREASADGSEAREDADEIIRASDRAASLAAQLLALGRG